MGHSTRGVRAFPAVRPSDPVCVRQIPHNWSLGWTQTAADCVRSMTLNRSWADANNPAAAIAVPDPVSYGFFQRWKECPVHPSQRDRACLARGRRRRHRARPAGHRSCPMLRGKHKPIFAHLDTGDHVDHRQRRQGRALVEQGRAKQVATTPATPAASRHHLRRLLAAKPADAVRRSSRACFEGPPRPPDAHQAEGVRRPRSSRTPPSRRRRSTVPPPAPADPGAPRHAPALVQTTGRRKEAIARARLRPGARLITVNGRRFETTSRRTHRMIVPSRCGPPRPPRTSTSTRHQRWRHHRSGRRHAHGHGPQPRRASTPRCASLDEGRRAHARPAREGEQEVRPQEGPQGTAVLEALSEQLVSLKFGTDGVRGVANIELTPSSPCSRRGRGARPGSTHRGGRAARGVGPMLEAAFAAGLAAGRRCRVLGCRSDPGGGGWLGATRPRRGHLGVPEPLRRQRHQAVRGRRPQAPRRGREPHRARAPGALTAPGLPPLSGEALGAVVDAGRVAAYRGAPRRALEDRPFRPADRRRLCQRRRQRGRPRVFSAAGADVVVINDRPNGSNINDHCGPPIPKRLRQAVVAEEADLGLAVDGDADGCSPSITPVAVVDGDSSWRSARGRPASPGRLPTTRSWPR